MSNISPRNLRQGLVCFCKVSGVCFRMEAQVEKAVDKALLRTEQRDRLEGSQAFSRASDSKKRTRELWILRPIVERWLKAVNSGR